MVPQGCGDPGFSTRQVEGLQGICWFKRKLAFQFPLYLLKSTLGPGARGFRRDPGGMKSPVLSSGFRADQHTDCAGVCGPDRRLRSGILGSTLPRSPGLQGRTQRVQVCTVKWLEKLESAGCTVKPQRPESKVADRSQESSMLEPEQLCYC